MKGKQRLLKEKERKMILKELQKDLSQVSWKQSINKLGKRFHSIVSYDDKGLKMKNEKHTQKKLACCLEPLAGTETGRVILVVSYSFSILSA